MRSLETHAPACNNMSLKSNRLTDAKLLQWLFDTRNSTGWHVKIIHYYTESSLNRIEKKRVTEDTFLFVGFECKRSKQILPVINEIIGIAGLAK